MERSNPGEILEGPRLDELRARHPEFISKMLVFGSDREATRSELAAAYGGLRGMERDPKGALHYSSNDIHNLFALVRSIPGVAEDSTGKRFTGVGVDESAADDLRQGQEEREDSAMSQQKLTLEDFLAQSIAPYDDSPPRQSNARLKRIVEGFFTKPIALPVWLWNLFAIALYLSVIISALQIIAMAVIGTQSLLLN